MSNDPRPPAPAARARRVRDQIRDGTYLVDIDTLAVLMSAGLDSMAAGVEPPRGRCRRRAWSGR